MTAQPYCIAWEPLLILDRLGRHRCSDISDIALHCSISSIRALKIIDCLADYGWLEVNQATRSGGASLHDSVEITSKLGILVVDLSGPSSGVTRVDGQIMAQRWLTLPNDRVAQRASVVREAARLIAEFADVRVVGLGICFPGAFGRGCETERHPPCTSPDAIGDALASLHDVPMVYESAANSSVLGALTCSENHPRYTVGVVHVADSVEVGIANRENVWTGRGRNARTVAHVGTGVPGVSCRCGIPGCWQATATPSAAISKYLASRLGEQALCFESLLERAQNGDKVASSAMSDMAESLGQGLKDLAQEFPVNEIVVTGDIVNAWNAYSNKIVQHLACGSTRHISVRAQTRGSTVRMRGAALAVASELL